MKALAFLACVLVALLMPAEIALGACHSGDTLERGLERGHLVALVDQAGNPVGCAVLVPRERTTAHRYDPSLGVFTSPDPVEPPVGAPYFGTYTYAFQNPTTYVDPMGTWPEWADNAAGAVGGAFGDAAGAVGGAVSDAAYGYTDWVYSHETLGNTIDAINESGFNPAFGTLVNGDQCFNGSWGGSTRSHDARKTMGDGNHCWKAAAWAGATGLTAVGGAGAFTRLTGLGRGAAATEAGAGTGAANAANAGRLADQLAMEELMAQATHGVGNRVIATGSQIDDIERLVSIGGRAEDWAKMSTHTRTINGRQVQVHWYENTATGQRIDFKSKPLGGF